MGCNGVSFIFKSGSVLKEAFYVIALSLWSLHRKRNLLFGGLARRVCLFVLEKFSDALVIPTPYLCVSVRG